MTEEEEEEKRGKRIAPRSRMVLRLSMGMSGFNV